MYDRQTRWPIEAPGGSLKNLCCNSDFNSSNPFLQPHRIIGMVIPQVGQKGNSQGIYIQTSLSHQQISLQQP